MSVKKYLVLLMLPVLAAIFAGDALFADVVFFKNGRVLEGRILNQDRRSLIIRTARGKKVISKSQVRRVRYGKLSARERRRLERARRREKERARRERAEARRAARRALNERRIARANAAAVHAGRTNFAGTTDWPAVRKSAMLPGWGQFERGRSTAGMLYAGGVGVGAILALASYNNFQSARNSYNALEVPGLLANSFVADDPLLALAYQIPFDAARRDSLRAHARFRAAGLLMTGLYLWNVIEHFFMGGRAPPVSGRVMHAKGLELRAGSPTAAHSVTREARLRTSGELTVSWRLIW